SSEELRQFRLELDEFRAKLRQFRQLRDVRLLRPLAPLGQFDAQSRGRGAIGLLEDGGYEFRQAAGADLNARRRQPVSALQVLEMAGAGAYGLCPLSVDFWWTAAARGGHGACPFCFAVLCSCFVQYRVKQNGSSSFCFFELRFFGNEVNT